MMRNGEKKSNEKYLICERKLVFIVASMTHETTGKIIIIELIADFWDRYVEFALEMSLHQDVEEVE